MIIAIWLFTLALLGLWSAAAWWIVGLVSGDGAWVGELAPWLGKVPFGDVLERWFPTWQQSAIEAIDRLRDGIEWLGQAAPVLVWSLWGAGTLMLLATAGVLTVVVVLVRRAAAARPAAPTLQP